MVVRARLVGTGSDGVGRATLLTNRVLEGNNVITVPARAICKLTTGTLSNRTMGGVFRTGNEPRSGPLVIRIASVSRIAPLIGDVPSRTHHLTREF